MGFSRQGYWSGLPFPSPEDLPTHWPLKLPSPLAFEITQPIRANHTTFQGYSLFWDDPLSSVCRVCFSLNKSTFYLSLCLSLNSFCNVIVVSHSVSDSLWPHGLQHTRLPCLSPTSRAYSNSCPSSWWCHPTTHPLSLPSPPTFSLSHRQGLFQCISSSHQVAKVLEFQL